MNGESPKLNACKCGGIPVYIRSDPRMPRTFGVRVQCPSCGRFTVQCRADWIASAAWNVQRGITNPSKESK